MIATPDWKTADGKTAAEACRIEHQILEHVKNALRVTLDWNAPKVGLSRKVSSVRFTLQSFQRHFERLMDLEEADGYLVVVAEQKPNFHHRAIALRDEHDDFRLELSEIVISISEIDEDDGSVVAQVCGEINALLSRIDAHDRREISLIQESIVRDEGGEG